jgi:hypothetical protein
LKIVAGEDLCVADSAVGGFDELVQSPPQSRWRQRTDIEEFVHVAAEQGEHPQLGRNWRSAADLDTTNIGAMGDTARAISNAEWY